MADELLMYGGDCKNDGFGYVTYQEYITIVVYLLILLNSSAAINFANEFYKQICDVVITYI